MKPLVWIGSSREDVIGFPAEARREAGHQLSKVQAGDDPDDWKPMQTVGAGVREIRIHEDGEFRVLYIATFRDAVYVLHAFRKKTQQTRLHDIQLAKDRLRQIKEP